MKSKLVQVLSHARFPWAAAALVVVIASPALWFGALLDDHFHRAKMLGTPPVQAFEHPLLEYFEFFPGDGEPSAFEQAGLVCWWSSPEMKGTFLRPLAAATHVLDYLLWPDVLALHHAHNLLWAIAAVIAVGWMYRQLIDVPAVAGLAVLAWAVDDAHAVAIGWIANRNALIAVTFAVIALGMHVRWRQRRRPRDLALCLASLALGLAGAEAALGIVAYIVAYQVFLDRGPLLRRGLALLPCLGLVAVWRAIYSAMGYGTHGSALYIDPGGEPVRFAAALAERWPLMMLNQWFGLSVDSYIILTRPLQIGLVAVAVVSVAAVLLIVAGQLVQSARARFWALGTALAIVPICATFPNQRLTLISGLGAFGLLSLLANHLGWLGEPADGAARLPVRLGAGLLWIVALSGAVVMPATLCLFHRAYDMAAALEDQLPADERVANQTIIQVNGNDLFFATALAERSAWGGPNPRGLVLLSSFLDDATVTRTADSSIRIRPASGFFTLDADRLTIRGDETYSVGQRFPEREFDVEIVAIGSNGNPAAVEYQFHVPLDDPSLRWLVLRNGTLEEFSVPAVGDSLELESVLPF